MKRIVLLVCGMLFLVSNTTEAQTSGGTTTRPAPAAPATYRAPAAQPAQTRTVYRQPTAARPAPTRTVAYRPITQPVVRTSTAAYSTRTAQGVAQIMASTGRVGHWGGNPGYEGCGAASTPASAYNNCCYSRSGMATVDVGYARGANGMWYCCRRYR